MAKEREAAVESKERSPELKWSTAQVFEALDQLPKVVLDTDKVTEKGRAEMERRAGESLLLGEVKSEMLRKGTMLMMDMFYGGTKVESRSVKGDKPYELSISRTPETFLKNLRNPRPGEEDVKNYEAGWLRVDLALDFERFDGLSAGEKEVHLQEIWDRVAKNYDSLLKREGIDVAERPECELRLEGPLTLENILRSLEEAQRNRTNWMRGAIEDVFAKSQKFPDYLKTRFADPGEFEHFWTDMKDAQEKMAATREKWQNAERAYKEGQAGKIDPADLERLNQEVRAARREFRVRQKSLAILTHEAAWHPDYLKFSTPGVDYLENGQRTSCCVGVGPTVSSFGSRVFGLNYGMGMNVDGHHLEVLETIDDDGNPLLTPFDHGKIDDVTNVDQTGSLDRWVERQNAGNVGRKAYTLARSFAKLEDRSVYHRMNQMGWAGSTLSDPGEKLAAKMASVAVCPESPEQRWGLSYRLLDMADKSEPGEKRKLLDAALQQINLAVELTNTKTSSGYLNGKLGVLAKFKGEPDAEQYFEEMLATLKDLRALNAREKNSPNSIWEAAGYYLQVERVAPAERKKQARATFEEAMETYPDDPETKFQYAMFIGKNLMKGVHRKNQLPIFQEQKRLLEAALAIAQPGGPLTPTQLSTGMKESDQVTSYKEKLAKVDESIERLQHPPVSRGVRGDMSFDTEQWLDAAEDEDLPPLDAVEDDRATKYAAKGLEDLEDFFTSDSSRRHSTRPGVVSRGDVDFAIGERGIEEFPIGERAVERVVRISRAAKLEDAKFNIIRALANLPEDADEELRVRLQEGLNGIEALKMRQAAPSAREL